MSRSFTASPGGLLLPDVPVPQRLQDSLYFLDKHGPNAPLEMHAQLHRVPALVVDCNADILRDRDLQERCRPRWRLHHLHPAQQGGQGQGKRGKLCWRDWHTARGPLGRQQEHAQLVQQMVEGEDATAIAK